MNTSCFCVIFPRCHIRNSRTGAQIHRNEYFTDLVFIINYPFFVRFELVLHLCKIAAALWRQKHKTTREKSIFHAFLLTINILPRTAGFVKYRKYIVSYRFNL